MKEVPKLFMVIPCYNEEEVLPITAPLFLAKLKELITSNKISSESRIMFIDDGSKDSTWSIISNLSKQNEHYIGINQSRNRGHQSTVLAGLMEAKDRADITISIDCDGQDDIDAMDKMIVEYMNGCDVVYGVRSSRKTDTAFKRFTAQSFYKFLQLMGADIVYNHADYRLISSKVLRELENYKECNMFLRGLLPLVGFKSTVVEYERKERFAGKSHYPLGKMIGLAIDGITSLSTRPIKLITFLGLAMSLLSFFFIVWILAQFIVGNVVSGWASTCVLVCFIGGIQLVCTGIIGEYIGKIYIETKARPRYIIDKRTEEKND